VSCLDKKSIEDFVNSSLTEAENKEILDHLTGCPACRNEAAFLTSIRVSLDQASASNACLSDETLVMFRDDLLEDQPRKKALNHLAGCENCLASWLSLNRALEEAAKNPVAAPAQLVKKAIAIGALQKAKAPLLERLFGPSPFFRLALAGSAAAVVFLLTVVLSGPGIPEEPESLDIPDKFVADAPTKLPPKPADKIPSKPADVLPSDKPVTVLDSTPDSADVKPVVADSGPGSNWLDGLESAQRQKLISGIKPVAVGRDPNLVKALSVAEKSAVVEGYFLGKSLGTVEAFSKYMGSTPEAQTLVTGLIQSAASLLNTSRTPGIEKLRKFGDSLGQKLAAGELSAGSAKRKIEVFQSAILENLSARNNARIGYELGHLSARLVLLAKALEGGHTPPQKAWPSSKCVARVRRMLEKSDALTDKIRYSVVNGLKSLGAISPSPDAPNKAARILDELQQVDRNIRAVR
jgi:hypothetical protein